MAKRLRKTLLDYLVIAISPAIIIALVDSLVLFLVQVFYHGSYEGKLAYVLTLFVIGAVLIGRISIDEGRERAVLFAVPLGLAILMAIDRFVTFQGPLASFSFPINCGLIALVWWAADKLTWDCTLIDEREEDSGEGLLETAGLDRPDHAAIQREIEPAGVKGDSPILVDHGFAAVPAKIGTVPVPEPEATTSRDETPTSWWDRFVERRRRPHAPGVWVVYFSLAALPLFGLGQLFLPRDDLAARQYAFQLLFVYTASGLGLLLSTSFLGLRRYLRQRRQEMPLAMVNLWLGIGAALIAGVMFAAMLLPRPNAEYAISELPFHIGSPDQHASPYGTGREAVEEEQPNGRPEPRENAKPDSPQSNKSGKSDSADNKDAQKTKSGQEPSKDNGKSQKAGEAKSGKKQDNSKESPQKTGETGTKQSASDQTKDQDNDKDKNKGKEAQPPDGKSEEKAKPTKGSGDAETKLPEKMPTPRENGAKRSGDVARTPTMPRVTIPHDVSSLAALFKWLLYAALAVLAAYAIWTNRAELLAALRDFAHSLADFWHRLFGGKTRREAEEAAADERRNGMPPRRFADFSNPFATGGVGRYRPEELVRYTFEALEAWARDAGHPRLPDQTPHEFARCLGSSVSPLADDARQLADLYCQVAYARGTLPAASVAPLSQLWREMCAAAGPPVSPAASRS